MTLEPEPKNPKEEMGVQGDQPPEEAGNFPPPPEFVETNETEEEEIYEFVESEDFDEKPRQPALTINIQSWATPVVGLAMLLIGLLGGFFARPLVAPEPTPTARPAAAAQPPASAAQQQQSEQQAQASNEDRTALMEALLPRVRHFKGNPDAPITLIEFSDFQ